MYFRKYSDIVLLINKINIHFLVSDKIIIIFLPFIFLIFFIHPSKNILFIFIQL